MTLEKIGADPSDDRASLEWLKNLSGIKVILKINSVLPGSGEDGLKKMLERVSKFFPGVYFFYFDASQRDDLEEGFQMRATPSIVILRDNQVVDPPLGRFNRFPPEGKASLEAAIKDALGMLMDPARNPPRCAPMAQPSATA